MAHETVMAVNRPVDDTVEKLLAKDYSEFLRVNTNSQLTEVTETIDGILAKLEEFCNIVEQIRNESKDVLFTTLPVLHERCSELQPVFQRIQQLEDFINVVKGHVEDSEEKVKVAEKEIGSKNIKKLMRTVRLPKFLTKTKEIQPYLKQEVCSQDYVAPKSFQTDDYFSRD